MCAALHVGWIPILYTFSFFGIIETFKVLYFEEIVSSHSILAKQVSFLPIKIAFSTGTNMKILQTVQMNLETLGISSIQSAQAFYNGKALLYLLLCGSLIIMNCVFLIDVAKSFEEYTDSIYIASVSVAVFFSLLFLISRMASLFELIDNLEKIVDESEYQYTPFKITSFILNI